MVETVFRVPPQATCAFPKDVPDGCDCLICDESHRFWEYTYREKRELFLDCFLRKCRVAVFFYDESQRVNLLDYVSPETIRNAMEKRGLDQSLLRERRLTWQHRCRDGDRFLAAVDRLLDHPELGLGREQHSLSGPGDHCPSPGLGQGAVHLEFWKLRDREALCHRP